jgi:small nuclear ribonucleoprotein (snRNP)-like protein
MTINQRGIGLLQAVWILAGLLVIVAAGWHIGRHIRSSDVEFTTPYQAVLLTNGSVYFGHLHGYGGHNPVLTDVFYVVTQTNPETKQSNNVLVKRGKELHEPDRMYLNPNQLLFVEPVGPNSKVAQLIAQATH